VTLAIRLLENPVAIATALTVVVAVMLKGPAYCVVVPAPGEGVLPSVVKKIVVLDVASRSEEHTSELQSL
jgi:hypothetical protein